MKAINYVCAACVALLLVSGCSGTGKDTPETSATDNAASQAAQAEDWPPKTKKADPLSQLPVRYQQPRYLADSTSTAPVEQQEDLSLKVGADIRSTRGPQPLWDILKRLAKLKGMSVSWASDVDQNLLVDVDISAEDDFFEAIDNLLRQVDYFHEVQGTTIVVRYKQTKRYRVPLPFLKSKYTYKTGGNYLSSTEAAGGTEGTIRIDSDNNEFDIWTNIAENLEKMLETWRTEAVMDAPEDTDTETADNGEDEDQPKEEKVVRAARQVSQGGSYYTIDKNIGLITVTAPRPILEKVDAYFEHLKESLFRQVAIEAKIIEVWLQDNSRIGLDWSAVLKNFPIQGVVEMGLHGVSNVADLTGQVWPFIDGLVYDKDSDTYSLRNPETNPNAISQGKFVSKVRINDFNFSVMLNALNEQGDARVLSNPKLTVMNGQPAMISVGREVTYIKSVNVDVDTETNTRTYTAETDSVVEGISLGVVASIVNKDRVILNLTPITTDLVGGKVNYETFGDNQRIGVPEVQLREMNTIVEVRDGEMLIIGGLIDKIEGKKGSFLPILGSIPYVRYLFGVEEKQKERRELVILLVPRII